MASIIQKKSDSSMVARKDSVTVKAIQALMQHQRPVMEMIVSGIKVNP